MSFNDLGLIEPIERALREEGYSQPTPVQQKSIPVALQQKDVLGCAQTGTGKTAAFAIPVLQLMQTQSGSNGRTRNVRALVLTPTRELAIQIGESFSAYGRYLPLKKLVIFGGVSQQPQVQALRQGVDILIATPGRLLDLMNQHLISLQNIEFFVLDEADRMLDMGFIHDVKKIIARLPRQRQTLFFSATMSPEVQKLSASLLSEPVFVEAAPPASTTELIQQSIYFVEKPFKGQLLAKLLSEQPVNRALVFTRTKRGADKVAKELNRAGIHSGAIHGNKSQNARQTTLQEFKSGKTKVLVATDIAARGIDIDGMSHVFNYELPNIPESYVHRIGRTGRAGANGIAVSFCDREERAFLKDIQKLIRKEITVVKDHAFANAVAPVVPQQQLEQRRPQGQAVWRKRPQANNSGNRGRMPARVS